MCEGWRTVAGPSCICAAKLASAIWTVTASGTGTGRRARNWPIPFPRRWHWRLPRSACLSLSRSHCPERGPPNMISDGARRHAASARSSGFVLVGVVWFLAIMTLLASAAVLWVGRSLDATENRRKVLLRELEEHALLARVQWLVATQRYTVAGLSVPGNAGAAPSKVDMDTSILPIGGSCLWMAGSSAWPMAGALRCSIALRASVFPASIRGYCPGCWRGWGSRRAGAGHGRPMVQLSLSRRRSTTG